MFAEPNNRVQADDAPRPGIGLKIGHITHFELKQTSEKRGAAHLKAVRPLKIMQGDYPMRCNCFIKAQITTISIVIQCGCAPTSMPVSIEPVLTTNTIRPTPIPNTITPDPGVICCSTADNVILLHTFSGHSRRVLDVSFSAQGEFLASSSQDMRIKLWDVKSGQEIHTFPMNSVDMADIDISASRNLLASGEVIWNLESLREINVLERGSPLPANVAFSPDGSVLALAIFEQQITLWDVMSGHPVFTFDRQEENSTKSMEFSPDGTLLAVGLGDGSVRLLDVTSGEIIKVLKYSSETDIHDLSFSPDGNYLATGGRLPVVILWDVASGEVARTFRLTDNVMSMDFSPGGTILATAGGYEHEVQLWDVESGTLLHSLPHNDQLSSVAFSPDGRLLAVGCFDSNIYLWEILANP